MWYVFRENPKQVDNAIISCTFVLSNFSIWDKLLSHSVLNLERENKHKYKLVIECSGRVILERNSIALSLIKKHELSFG